MQNKPAHRIRMTVPVSRFLSSAGDSLEMELIAGERGLERTISDAVLNQPGLALAGFYEYFAHRRIQVFGNAELAYLRSLDADVRRERLGRLLSERIPCLILTRGNEPITDICELGEAHSVPVLRSRMTAKHFVNAATIELELLSAPRQSVQGTMVEIMGQGVLIEGRTGIGKSETALSLIRRGHALVSDDITSLRLNRAGRVVGSPLDVTRYHMEIRGVGIVHVPSLFGVWSVRTDKELDLVATLTEGSEDYADAADEIQSARSFLGISIPRVWIHVAPGRDLANVIETAALDYRLKRLGHDAAKELDLRLVEVMTGGRDAGK